jgi:hypothetical protein
MDLLGVRRTVENLSKQPLGLPALFGGKLTCRQSDPGVCIDPNVV